MPAAERCARRHCAAAVKERLTLRGVAFLVGAKAYCNCEEPLCEHPQMCGDAGQHCPE